MGVPHLGLGASRRVSGRDAHEERRRTDGGGGAGIDTGMGGAGFGVGVGGRW